MDRITRAVQRLWGTPGSGHLPPSPRFAAELAEAGSNGKLPLLAPRISKWTFGHQLEHAYRSAHYVLDRLDESLHAKNGEGKMGFWGVGMMIGGFIPRGMFPTIPQLEPTGGTLAEIRPLQQSLEERLAKIDFGLKEIKTRPGKSRHPRMKYLTSAQWMFFWDIHHRHHLAIMRDIAQAAR